MKKSSLKNYITLLEAAVSAASNARDYWMREHERRVKALTRLQEKNKIAELKADAAANANARDYRMGQHELKDEELLKAKDEIAELRRRLDDNGGLCTLRAKLTGETCKETNDRLREDNERLSRLLRFHPRNHSLERRNKCQTSVTPRSTPSAGSSSICS